MESYKVLLQRIREAVKHHRVEVEDLCQEGLCWVLERAGEKDGAHENHRIEDGLLQVRKNNIDELSIVFLLCIANISLL